jgi:hypothetical protein
MEGIFQRNMSNYQKLPESQPVSPSWGVTALLLQNNRKEVKSPILGSLVQLDTKMMTVYTKAMV